MPTDIDANNTTIVPAEKTDQSLLTVKEELNLVIEQQRKLPSNDVKTKQKILSK
jgi:hypothetical protein